MSGNGVRILAVDCPHCGRQLGLPFVAYIVGHSIRCAFCYGVTRLTVPNRVFLFGKSAVPYWVNFEVVEDSPPRRAQEAPKRSSGGAGSSKKGKAKSSNSSTNNGKAKAKSSNTSTNNGNLKAKSSTNNGTLKAKPSKDENSEDDQDTEDENSEDDDQKPSIVVNGNQVSGNSGDKNGGFSVGNTTFRARKFVVNVH